MRRGVGSGQGGIGRGGPNHISKISGGSAEWRFVPLSPGDSISRSPATVSATRTKVAAVSTAKRAITLPG
jgi:hypothetical protein